MKKFCTIVILGLVTASLSAQANYWPLPLLEYRDIERPVSVSVSFMDQTVSEAIENDQWGYHPEGFYPIGWSDDGKFAYIIEESFSERGGSWRPVSFNIMDMVEDELIYQKTIFDDDFIGEVANSPLASYEDWKKISAEYEQELTRQRIGKITLSDFSTFPLVLDNETYQAHPFGIEGYDENDREHYLSEYGIRIEKDTRRSKVIYKGITPEDDLVPQIGITVFGAFKSPYENRIAVLYGVWDTGWEGTPAMDLHLSGSHLGLGFK